MSNSVNDKYPKELYVRDPKLYGRMECDGYESLEAFENINDLSEKDTDDVEVGVYELKKIITVKNETTIVDG